MSIMNAIFLTTANPSVSPSASTVPKTDTGILQKELDGLLTWIINFGKSALIALLVFFVGKKLIHLLLKVTKRGLNSSNIDEGVSGFVATLVKTVAYILLFIIIAGILGLETSSLVALVGSAGFTIGLALQGSLSNFAGGVLILINKPFRVGDYIVAGTNEGTVTKIDIFYTHIATVDNKNIVLPNGALSNMNVINATKETTRRLDLIIPVAYDSDIDHVKATLGQVCNADERILADKEVEIYLYEFGASAINMTIRIWTSTENYWPLKWELQEKIKKALDGEGISIPFNQLDVNLVQINK